LFTPSSSHYKGLWEQVTSITYERTDDYYDLHVPGAEHYLAEGIWHHNTGKSFGGLLKLDTFARYYPGCRCLILRKTRVSLVQSTLVTYEQKILGERFSEKASNRHVYYHGGDQEYRYPNKSIAAIAGMDKSAKVMSTEWDFILFDEGTEASEDNHESLTTRLRNYKAGYQQLLFMCNPDSPMHYLIKRRDAGKLRMIAAKHTDNPLFFNQETGKWRLKGKVYMNALDDLTGARLKRFRDGIWCMTEGMVFDGFEEETHVFNGWDDEWNLVYDDKKGRFGDGADYTTEPPRSWRRSLSIDFGFSNPFVCQFWAEDSDGRLYLYREIYMSQKIVEDHAAEIIKICDHFDEPDFSEIITDHDAEDRATLIKHLRKNRRFARLSTTAAKKDVEAGCDAVRTRLKKRADGRARIYVRRDAVWTKDKELEAKHLPSSTLEEIWSYIYGLDGKPVKKNDHGCFVAGTMIETLIGERPIETIKAGDLVLTRKGYKRVLAAGLTNPSAPVKTLMLNDGRTLIGTGNHPVYVKGKDFIQMDALRYNDALLDVRENPQWRSSVCLPGHRVSSACASMGLSIGVIPKQSSSVTATISGATSAIKERVAEHYIETSTNFITELFQRAIMSIIGMVMLLITTSKISKQFQRASITTNTFRQPGSDKQSPIKAALKVFSKRCGAAQLSGIAHLKVAHGTANTEKRFTRIASRLRASAINAAKSLNQWDGASLIDSVLTTASPAGGAKTDSITSQRSVHSARRNSVAINTLQRLTVRGHALLNDLFVMTNDLALTAKSSSRPNPTKQNNAALCRVHTLTSKAEPQPVYNLTVEDSPEYYANGVLVHNCDGLRYRVATTDLKAADNFTVTKFRR